LLSGCDLVFAAVIPLLLRDRPTGIAALEPPGPRFTMFAAILAVAFIAGMGGYAQRSLSSLQAQIGSMLNGVAATVAVSALALAALDRDASVQPGWAALSVMAVALGLASLRVVTTSLITHDAAGRFAPRTVLVGGGENGARLIQLLRHTGDRSLRVIGFVDDRSSRLSDGARVVPFLGETEMLFALIAKGDVDQVIVALPWSAEGRIIPLLRRLAVEPVHVRLAPDLIAYHFAELGETRIGGLRMIHLADRPASSLSTLVKRVEDVVLGVLCLIAFAAPMLLVAIAIRLDDPGPVLFRQRRTGFNNREFEILKFRTMRLGMATDEAGAIRQAARADARVTRVGAVLRRTSLDELPQLFNVLRGDMSLVGPRPHAPGTRAGNRPFEQVVACYAARHRVRPGLTGLAQVRGLRGETDTEAKLVRRVESDLEYIETWSLWLDLLILFRTAMAIVTMRNAY